jgi:hypothetical protein
VRLHATCETKEKTLEQVRSLQNLLIRILSGFKANGNLLWIRDVRLYVRWCTTIWVLHTWTRVSNFVQSILLGTITCCYEGFEKGELLQRLADMCRPWSPGIHTIGLFSIVGYYMVAKQCDIRQDYSCHCDACSVWPWRSTFAGLVAIPSKLVLQRIFR